ncbi:MAG: hypothetical protein V4463_16685 [Pseudomonadota bacterium]
MRHLLLVLAGGAIALGASAQTPSSDINSSIPVTAPKAQKMWPEQFDDYKRVYDLSNGQSLVLTGQGTAMYAQISGESRHRINATALGTFVATDRRMSMHIDLDPGGEASGFVSYVPERGANLAYQAEPVTVRFAGR